MSTLPPASAPAARARESPANRTADHSAPPTNTTRADAAPDAGEHAGQRAEVVLADRDAPVGIDRRGSVSTSIDAGREAR